MPNILGVIGTAAENDAFLESMVNLHQGRLLNAIEGLQDNIVDSLSQLETDGGRLIGPKVNLILTK